MPSHNKHNGSKDSRKSVPGRTLTPSASRSWSDREVTQLKKLASQNTPTRVIGIKLSRTPAAIYSKASAIGLSLKPTNQRPYG